MRKLIYSTEYAFFQPEPDVFRDPLLVIKKSRSGDVYVSFVKTLTETTFMKRYDELDVDWSFHGEEITYRQLVDELNERGIDRYEELKEVYG